MNNIHPIPIVGNRYQLIWANSNYEFKLMSWSNDGTCIMQGSRGNTFHTHLSKLKRKSKTIKS
jgi:hypothetical protein